MRIELFDNGLSGCVIEGDIILSSYDERTQDFELIMKRNGLRVTQPVNNASLNNVDNVDKWGWLKSYPIESIIIGDNIITPTWKPNIFGELADENAFQQVKLLDDTIQLSVHANGTPEEVYNRYNPYVDRKTGYPVNHVKIDNHPECKSFEETLKQVAETNTTDKAADIIASSLFE